MNKTLYIIGNGFDLYHGIASNYSDFGEFLRKKDLNTYQIFERYFEVNSSFWYEFESQLAAFDVDTLIDDASIFLVGYGADEWSDSYHHDYQYEIQRAVRAVSIKMKELFADWVRQLNIPNTHDIAGKLLNLKRDAIYLNFNYTSSLQKIYHVPDNNILHIHGEAANIATNIVLGHAWMPDDRKFTLSNIDPENEDVRVIEGQEYINEYFKRTFKPTKKIIENNISFFSSLSLIEEIFVIGHSLSEVDCDYFFEIIKNIAQDNVQWKVSYYNNMKKAQENFSEFGISSKLVKFVEIKDF